MAKPAQAIFKKICVRNKLADEGAIDRMLVEFADPEDLVKHWISQQKLSEKIGLQLLDIYHKKLEQHFASLTEIDSQDSPQAPPSQDVQPDPPVKTAKKESPDPGQPTARTSDPSEAGKPAQPTRKKPVERATDSGLEQPEARGSETGVKTRPEDSTRVRSESATAAVARAGIVAAEVHSTIVKILQAAVQHGASDIHITAGRSPVLRVAGALRELGLAPIPPDECREVLLSLLNDEQRQKFDKTLDMDFCYDGGSEFGRFRTNYFVEKGGMDAVFRLISEKVPTMEELKLPEQIAQLTEASTGIILVTGPKSSGKTTTLAAMIDLINSTRSEHILTIEDPIEFIHTPKKAYITQREVGTHTDTFGTALTGAMHEAPDVIMVGELRDLETTSLVITAAETGFLVLTTLHTPDAIRTIGRVLGVFPAREQAQIRSMLAKSLRGIVSQQLVPSTDGKSLELAVEVLVNTPAIGNLVRENRTFQLPSLMQVGGRVGMVMMDDSLIRLARDGRISKREALARAADDNKVRKELKISAEE
jgi:twitching motility protein PilT